MKVMKWKKLILTCLVCLLPVLLGVALWKKLPQEIAIHFDMYNNPDNFASKGFAVFGLPCMMVLFQIICCVIFDVNAHFHGERVKFERITKWIIPVMTVILQAAIFGVALGWKIDIRAVAAVVVGTILVVLGNVLPKFDRVKNWNLDTDKARKINRFIGYETVILGLLFYVSLLFPPVATVVCVFLLIPYAILGVIYGIRVGRK